MNFKHRIAEFNGYFREKSPLLLAFFLTIIIVIPIDILSKLLSIENPEEISAIASFIKVSPIKELAFQLLIIAPLTQEFLYRGPIRLLILIFPGILKIGLLGKIIAWIFIIIPTYYWAAIEGGGHAFPLDAFFVGLIFGWSVLKTKSLETAVVLHIFYNAINLIGALIRFKVL
ncbi:MAG: CPBP family glutamic-type intramembrane protease [Minisyncoccota bacterium]